MDVFTGVEEESLESRGGIVMNDVHQCQDPIVNQRCRKSLRYYELKMI